MNCMMQDLTHCSTRPEWVFGDMASMFGDLEALAFRSINTHTHIKVYIHMPRAELYECCKVGGLCLRLWPRVLRVCEVVAILRCQPRGVF